MLGILAGFIAYSKDPSLPPIEGATHTEVDQKIQESIGADLGSHSLLYQQLEPALVDDLRVVVQEHDDIG